MRSPLIFFLLFHLPDGKAKKMMPFFYQTTDRAEGFFSGFNG
jgi:hypothetical protein